MFINITASAILVDLVLILAFYPFPSIRIMAYSHLAAANLFAYLLQTCIFLFRKEQNTQVRDTLHFVCIQIFAFTAIILLKLTEVLVVY